MRKVKFEAENGRRGLRKEYRCIEMSKYYRTNQGPKVEGGKRNEGGRW